jgi:Fumarylacetoacetate (FAA) hydrolase family
MKLLRYGSRGQEKPGMIDRDGQLRDLSGVIKDLTPDTLAPGALDKLRQLKPASLPAVSGSPRLGACIAGVPKLVCVGLNYVDHAKEGGMQIPTEPVLFMKAITSINGPNDDVMLPKGAEKGDWEVELGIVIGSKAQYVGVPDALKHVAGYCIVNDVSERNYQLERRHLLPDGPLAGDGRRGARSAGARSFLRGERPAHAERLDQEHDLLLCADRQLHQPLPDLVAGRRDPDGNAGRGRARHEAAALSQAGRYDASGHHRAGRAAADGRRV